MTAFEVTQAVESFPAASRISRLNDPMVLEALRKGVIQREPSSGAEFRYIRSARMKQSQAGLAGGGRCVRQ